MSEFRMILADCDGVLLNWNASFTEWMWSEHGYKLVDVKAYDIAHRFNVIDETCENGTFDFDKARRLVDEFNVSEAAFDLDPMPGAVGVIKDLYENYGHAVTVITSLNGFSWCTERRFKNLRDHFGPAIKDVRNMSSTEGKREVLSSFQKGHWWIEDLPSNADLGSELGHQSILLEHPYNANTELNKKVQRMSDWHFIGVTIIRHNTMVIK